MLIAGLGMPAVPEQMDAPEKSMPSADTGGGGTAFSEVMSRVSEKQEEKAPQGDDRPVQKQTVKEQKEMDEKEVPEKASGKKAAVKQKKIPEQEEQLLDLRATGKKEAAEEAEIPVAESEIETAEMVPQVAEKTGGGEKLFSPEPGKTPTSGIPAAGLTVAAAGEQVRTVHDPKGEGRSSRKEAKKEQSTLKVVDLRKKRATVSEKAVNADKGGEINNEKTGTEEFSRERQFTVIERDAGDARGREPVKPSLQQITRNDQSVLFKHLQETVNDKIVRQTGIILKDNSSGELRLVLKPEKMGTVRIRLELQDNHIAGRIFVDNSSVKEVFDHNLEALYRAFRENGYETTGLNVTVGNGNGEHGNKHGRGIPKGAIKMLEEFVPLAEEVIHADYMVNLVV